VHPHFIDRHVRSRFPEREVERRLASVDLVAIDIDECFSPGFSQTILGHRIFWTILTRPLVRADRRYLPQLLAGGAYIERVELARRLTGRLPTNRELMRRYERSMRGIPEAYFRDGAAIVAGRAHAGAAETVAILGRHFVVGLVSFGIHLLVEEVGRRLAGVSFVECNRVSFDLDAGGGRRGFAGYLEPLRADPRDKRELLEDRLRRHGARVPLIVGNGADELEMAGLARERGGLSIGFRPEAGAAAGFDLVVSAADWRPLGRLVERALSRAPLRGQTRAAP
jgi:hypothetical protein